jgi:hypothetical protein
MLALGACGGNGGGVSGVSLTPQLQATSTPPKVSATMHRLSGQKLYVTSAFPFFFDAYRLPLHGGAMPKKTEMGVNEPVPIVDDGRDLYVGSFDDGTIYTYPLPLSNKAQKATTAAAATAASEDAYVAPFSAGRSADPTGLPAMNQGLPSGLTNLSGLAVSDNYLYVAGVSFMLGESEVLEYRLPLAAGEAPSGSVAGFPFDFLGLTASNHTLYVASTVAGTVGAYRVPLTTDEPPRYTIATKPQSDGAVGVAVECDRHLYVSLYTTGDVYEYRLPYRSGESHKTLDVQSGASGGLPYGVAVGEGHLFVTAGSILSYRLPLSSGTAPEAIVPFAGFAAGVAAGE